MSLNFNFLPLNLETELVEGILHHDGGNRTEELSRLTSWNDKFKCNSIELLLKACSLSSLSNLSLLDSLCTACEQCSICLVVDYSCACRKKVVPGISVLYDAYISLFSEINDILVKNNLHLSLLFP